MDQTCSDEHSSNHDSKCIEKEGDITGVIETTQHHDNVNEVDIDSSATIPTTTSCSATIPTTTSGSDSAGGVAKPIVENASKITNETEIESDADTNKDLKRKSIAEYVERFVEERRVAGDVKKPVLAVMATPAAMATMQSKQPEKNERLIMNSSFDELEK